LPVPPLSPTPQDSGRGAVGQRLRTERERQQIGLRELARRVNVSASLISQVELGKATPSVGTLYAIVSELRISLDELLSGTQASPSEGGARRGMRSDPTTPVVLSDETEAIQLDSGVQWERLTPVTEHEIDFLRVVYEVGGASCAKDVLMRHAGKEYGHVLEGRLSVTVGFETYELGPGDSISFDSTTPHRLFNAGDEPVHGLWFIVGRRDDVRFSRPSSS
jgi:transcriptional regulator with XRE-family HTH domain